MHKTTIYEIAEKAGVSAATVSRVIHSPHLLNEKTLHRIKRIMEENNYSYNAAAAGLSKGTSSGIAVLVPRIDSSVFSDTLTGVQEYMSSKGYYVTVAGTNYNPSVERRQIKLIEEQRLAGILLTGYAKENEQLILSLAEEIPLIIMWEKAVEPLNFVGFDNYTTTYGLLEYLASLGHRRIAAILGPYSRIVRAAERHRAYCDFLKDYDLPLRREYVSEGVPTLADGKRAMEALLRLKEKPTAVFCSNDLQAIAAIRVIGDAGLHVPEDISICGFDDTAVAQHITPPLTTLHVPSKTIGKKSAQFLHELIRKKQPTPVRYTVDTPFIARNSCQAPTAQDVDIR